MRNFPIDVSQKAGTASYSSNVKLEVLKTKSSIATGVLTGIRSPAHDIDPYLTGTARFLDIIEDRGHIYLHSKQDYEITGAVFKNDSYFSTTDTISDDLTGCVITIYDDTTSCNAFVSSVDSEEKDGVTTYLITTESVIENSFSVGAHFFVSWFRVTYVAGTMTIPSEEEPNYLTFDLRSDLFLSTGDEICFSSDATKLSKPILLTYVHKVGENLYRCSIQTTDMQENNCARVPSSLFSISDTVILCKAKPAYKSNYLSVNNINRSLVRFGVNGVFLKSDRDLKCSYEINCIHGQQDNYIFPQNRFSLPYKVDNKNTDINSINKDGSYHVCTLKQIMPIEELALFNWNSKVSYSYNDDTTDLSKLLVVEANTAGLPIGSNITTYDSISSSGNFVSGSSILASSFIYDFRNIIPSKDGVISSKFFHGEFNERSYGSYNFISSNSDLSILKGTSNSTAFSISGILESTDSYGNSYYSDGSNGSSSLSGVFGMQRTDSSTEFNIVYPYTYDTQITNLNYTVIFEANHDELFISSGLQIRPALPSLEDLITKTSIYPTISLELNTGSILC